MGKRSLSDQKLRVRRLPFYAALFAFFSFVLSFPISPANANSKYASLVMDADSGMILHKRNADKRLHPASLTKVMTLMMLFDAIEQGRTTLRSRIKVSAAAAKAVPSKLNLPVGSSIRVEDAIYALVTKSANDVAIAVAEHISGTEPAFARAMTRRAKEIGMNRTVFRNASGLHHPKQVSTARDMARLAQTVITHYPKYYRYFSKKVFKYRGKTYRSHNRLMKSYKGMDGMKTGYIHKAGFNLISSAVRDNQRIIGVVFGGRTSKSRNAHMRNLLDNGFKKMRSMQVARAPVPPRKPSFLVALAAVNRQTLNDLGTLAKTGINPEEAKWAMLNPALQGDMFSRMMGEGDFDPDVRKRLETGLMAISAVKGLPKAEPKRKFQPRNTLLMRSLDDPWSIQVGVFGSRARTDRAIRLARQALPAELSSMRPIIVPIRSNGKLLFRARLSGYSQAQARAACLYLADCVTVPPVRH